MTKSELESRILAEKLSSPKVKKLNPRGTKMFIIPCGSSVIHQFTLREKFNESTASDDYTSFCVAGQDTNPIGLEFDLAGTKMFIDGGETGTVYQYALAEEFNIATAEYENISLRKEGLDTEKLGDVGDALIESRILSEKVGAKHDAGKPLYNLIPVHAEAELVDVLTFGATKYAPNQWRNVENAIERYTAAAMRHLAAYRMGETHDTESGKHHLAHAMCCLAFIIETDLEQNK